MYGLVPEKILRLVYEPFYLAIYNGWKLIDVGPADTNSIFSSLWVASWL